jgi:hypothetical protein
VFANSIILHVFKNATLLNEMKPALSSLLQEFKDVPMLHKIADNFSSKNET